MIWNDKRMTNSICYPRVDHYFHVCVCVCVGVWVCVCVCVYVNTFVVKTRVHIFENIYIFASCDVGSTGWRRLIGSLISIGHFPQKSPISSGSFVENDLQLRGSYESSPPCRWNGHYMRLLKSETTYS